MPIEHIHTYLVRPRQREDERIRIGGAAIALNGRLYELLSGVYDKSDLECDTEIIFTPAQGRQQNDCRDLLVEYCREPSLPNGRLIPQRLSNATTLRSGLGLLFLIKGREGREHKFVISRFPTDTGILAEEGGGRLNVEFLERVFMKSAYSYKAAAYRHGSLNAGFWNGRIVDKQISSSGSPSSEYWIRDFLASDFRVTSANGTRRLARALRAAFASATDVAVKQDLVAASILLRGLAGRQVSVDRFIQQFNLTDEAATLIKASLPNEAVAAQVFRLDLAEVAREIRLQSIELDSGAIMTAPSGNFDDVFTQRPVRGRPGEKEFTARGVIVDERLRRGRP